MGQGPFAADCSYHEGSHLSGSMAIGRAATVERRFTLTREAIRLAL
jgi:hypothetical protein